MAAEDMELMIRYCDGDAAAFRQLYGRVAPKLRSYLVRVAREVALADDLLQQTFLKVHRARGAYVRGADPVPWMYAIAHRTFLDEMRRRKRARVRVARDPDAMPERHADLDGREAEPGREVLPVELGAAAIAALDALPEKQRQAVILTKLEGRSVAEAASIAGTTPGAMKVRAHRGYVALRRALADAPAGDEPAVARGGRR